ncbi:MAG TPA: TonB-dependent receptor [Blastocatellia bacterium]|nr:TonB-dependent receptor [Blastocatellia bacterium]
MFGSRIYRKLQPQLVIATMIALLCCTVAVAQESSVLSGTVTDPQGKTISGATVTITNTATSVSRSAKTGDDGAYVFNQVQPGTYTVRVEATGFKTAVREDVKLIVKTPTTLNIEMEVGAVSETVSVSGGEVRLNTQDATIGNAITASQISRLPLEGQNIVSLLALQPGVTFIGNTNAEGNTTDYRNGSVNGSKSDQSNVTLDGVDVNDQQNGFAFNSVLRVTAESLQEFRVVTSNPNAEQGRSSGAQVSLVTKTGTNNWHGSAYEFHRNTITSANDWFNNAQGRFTANDFAVQRGVARVGDPRAPRPKLIRNVFGASLGGPIKKDRFFFFMNYEGRRDSREESVVRVVPGDDLRKGIFTYVRCLEGSPSACTKNTVAKLDFNGVKALDPLHIGPNAEVLKVFNQYPLANDNTVGDGLNTFGFRFNSPIHLRWNTYIARLDYNLTESGNHTLFVRGNLQNDRDNSVEQFPGIPTFVNFTNNKGIAAGYNATLRQNLVNVARFGYTRQGTESAGASPFSNAPLVSFRTFSDLIPATRSVSRITPVWNAVDDVSWVKGSHSLQFGGNLRWIRNNRVNFAPSFHSAIVNKAWLFSNSPIRPRDQDLAFRSTEHAMAALLGLVTQVTARYNVGREGDRLFELPQGAPIQRHYAANEYETYVQDSWRVKPNLTLTYGLRYSLYSPPWETRGLQVSPDFPLGKWFDIRGGLMQKGVPNEESVPDISFVLSGPKNGSKGFYDWDKNNFAPRFAFAYSPTTNLPVLKWITGEGTQGSKMVIRGGYSMVYDRIGGALAINADSGALSFGIQTQLVNAAGIQRANTSPRFTGLNNIPTQLLPSNPCSSGGAVKFPCTFPTDLDNGFAITAGIDDNLVTPYSQSINFSIQRELPGNFTFEAAYVGRLGRHILVNYDMAMPLNLVDPASGMDYFTAAQTLARLDFAGTPVEKVGKIPFWEHIFPDLAGGGLTATQVAYLFYSRSEGFGPDYTTALFVLDVACDPCSKFGPYALFDDQFSNLNAFRSQGNTNYHSLQLILGRRFSNGLEFNANYTFSKSHDIGSAVERNGLFAAPVLNSWSPRARYSVSDFDMTHQFNAGGFYEIPVGRGRRFLSNSNGWINGLLGGWSFASIFRLTSGLPTSIGNGFNFPTNWEFTGFATQNKPITGTGVFKNVKVNANDKTGGPNIFSNPDEAFKAFQNTLPGGVGTRNLIRGDGLFNIDASLAKSWRIKEGHALNFRWEVFNVTNTPSFDPFSLIGADLDSRNTFGKYSATLNSARVMQFGLKYTF